MDRFSTSGTKPSQSSYKMSIISGASSGANSFKTLFSTISGQIPFPTFRLDNESCTSLTLTRRLEGAVDWLLWWGSMEQSLMSD